MSQTIHVVRGASPARFAIVFGCAALAVACSGSSGDGTTIAGTGGSAGTGSGGADAGVDGCPDLAGAYAVTTEIVITTCPVGRYVISQPVTWTFAQSAPSCAFTMTNSLYSSSTYTGHFRMAGDHAEVIWTSVDPAPKVGGRALTYTSESLAITPAAASPTGVLSGSFDWSSAYPCTGTTNVCHGSVASGCLTPE